MSFPKYPAYKPSGVEWLGDVPAHWEILQLRHVVVRSNAGEVIDRSYWGGESELLYTCAIEPLFSDFRGFPNEKRTRAGDLLLTRNGTPYVHEPKPGSIYTNVVQRISLANHLHRHFMAIAVRAAANNLRGYGVSIDSLNFEIWKCLPIAIPKLDEQSAIAAFLDHETAKIDALIAEQEKLIALLAEKRQATISHAVTRGLNPEAPMKDSGVAWLGEVPGHWGVVPLKYLVNFRSGGTPSKEKLNYWNGDVPWASAKDLKPDRLTDTIDHITLVAIEEKAADLIPRGAVLVVVRGMILARIFPVAIIDTPMAINQDLKAVIPGERIGSEFLAWLLRGTSDDSLRRLDEAGHGTKALRMDAWASMLLPVPPIPEQAQIAQFIEREMTRLAQLQNESERAIALLKERRSALIAAAVTGQIDVRGAVAAATI